MIMDSDSPYLGGVTPIHDLVEVCAVLALATAGGNLMSRDSAALRAALDRLKTLPSDSATIERVERALRHLADRYG